MNFRKVKLDDKQLIDSYLAKYPCYGSTYSMTYLACWDYFDIGNLEIAEHEDALVLRFPHKDHMRYLAGLTAPSNFPHLVDEIFSLDSNAVIVQLESNYVALLDENKYIIEHNIDYDEYVYNTGDLINLAGKKYHGKRNHIKRFYNSYPDFIFRDYTMEDRDAVMSLFDSWEDEKGVEIGSERKAISFMLDNMKQLELMASVIEIDGVIRAFTLGEVTSANVGIVHIEKADVNYEGLYPTINQLFAKAHLASTDFINRQEDIGIEGLRRAKRSYYPVKMSEKCNVSLRQN